MPRPSLGGFVLGLAESEPYRRSTRISVGIPITICGKDALGCDYEESTQTIDIGKHGVRTSTSYQLLANAEVRISNDQVGKSHPARVVWQGGTQLPDGRTEIGVEFLVPFEAESFWVIKSRPDDWQEGRLELTTPQKLEYFWVRSSTLQRRPELEALSDAAEPSSDLMPPLVPAVDQDIDTVSSSEQASLLEVAKPDEAEAPLSIEAATPSVEPPWGDGWVPSPAPKATAEVEEKDLQKLDVPQKAPVSSGIAQPSGGSPAAALTRLVQMLSEQVEAISQGADKPARTVESAAEAAVAKLQDVRKQIEDQLEAVRDEHQLRMTTISASSADELLQNSEVLLTNFQKQLQRMKAQQELSTARSMYGPMFFVKILVGLIMATAVLLGFAYRSTQPIWRLRAEPPADFVLATVNLNQRSVEEQVAHAYWNSAVRDLQRTYRLGTMLPKQPPPEFEIQPQDAVNINSKPYADASRGRYWERLRTIWNDPRIWEKSYEWNTDWISSPLKSLGLMLRKFGDGR